MDFGTGGREGYCEEEDEKMINYKSGKFHFSSSTAASASSSSPQHYKGFFPMSNGSAGTEESGKVALGNSTGILQKEHMFDKVVTPSDVGKLNRLVIPKQHAEKYFPLDSSTNEKGLLLNFEDRVGKPWRFRYSYWNSSQSYVMTKGWSRFVKEKKLDAGDIVSFQRGVGESGKDRLYIDWRRRQNAPSDATSFQSNLSFPHNFAFHRSVPWSPSFFRPPPATMSSAVHFPQPPNNYMNFHQSQDRNSYHYNNVVGPCQGPIIYLRSATASLQDGGGGGIEPMVFDSVPVVHGKAAAKRLRLFGVNMECAVSDESINPAAMSSQSRLYNGIPLQSDFFNKGKSSSLSLDLEM